MKIAILGTRGIPNNYGGFEQCAEYLAVGLVKKGYKVTVYSPSFHPYMQSTFKGVSIIKKPSPVKYVGNSASNFIYDYLCLKDAVSRDFDIILQLGLITSSLSIIFCNHNKKIIATNIDGIEWQRSKWNRIIQYFTKLLEKYGVKYSDYLIADNLGIKKYLLNEYKRNSKFIAYGTSETKNIHPKHLIENNITSLRYILTIARLEPENNLELMCDSYIESNLEIPYYIIGNHLTKYGDFLKDKYRRKGIYFLGPIYNKSVLDSIRFYSTFYLHGHSVGGTNPSLLEAMSAQSFIISHNNVFNKAVLEENAYYFNSKDELSNLLKQDNILNQKKKFIKNNLKIINTKYRWSNIIDQYEKYFLEILKKN